MRAIFLTLVFCPAMAMAETPMTAEEFEAFSENRTLVWALDGVDYGIERYAPGRRVIWSDLTGTCLSGHWEEAGDDICFHYDYDPDDIPTCWRFFRDGAEVVADHTNGEEPLRLGVVSLEGRLICPEFGA